MDDAFATGPVFKSTREYVTRTASSFVMSRGGLRSCGSSIQERKRGRERERDIFAAALFVLRALFTAYRTRS